MAATSAAAADSATTVTRRGAPEAGRPVEGSIRWCRSSPSAEPAAPVASGGGDSATRQLERYLVGDSHGPRAAADGKIAAGIDETRADAREELRDTVDRVPFADPAEVEASARLQLDRRPETWIRPPQRERSASGTSSRRRHVVERAVVAGRHDCVVHGGVEAPAGRLAGIERELDDPHEIWARPGDEALSVEQRELGVVAESRHHLLETLELRFGPVERAVGTLSGLRVEEQLDVGSHRSERTSLNITMSS